MENEVWRAVVGYEGYYEVSNQARVRSTCVRKGTAGGILKQKNDRKGYPTVYLSVNGKVTTVRVHRLLAIAFIPNPWNKAFINHINGIKDDNRIENLEWCTHKENVHHALESGLTDMNKRKRLDANGVLSLYSRKVGQFDLNGNKINEYISSAEAERKTGICSVAIRQCAKGRTKKSGGFSWEYLDGTNGAKFRR